jgi:hypothetical protein
MQRALSLEDTPALSRVLRFMLAAPWFAIAAGTMLLWYGEAALQTRWSPVTLALTHLLTLGFLAMTMAGAILQMLPVVAGFAVPCARLAAGAAWIGLAFGTPLLAAGFLTGLPVLFGAAALILGLPMLGFVAAIGVSLARRAPAGALPMIAGMRLALPALAVTATLGMSLAAWLAGGPAVPVMLLTDLHAAWGLSGWVAILVIAVAFQVIPMFQATPTYPRTLEFALPATVAVLLGAWTATMFHPGWQAWLERALALTLATLAGYTLYLLKQRKRPNPDTTTLYWRLSLASLLACVALYLWPAGGDKRQLLLGIVFLVGFAMSAVNGMLFKIAPFLLWYHLAAAGLPRNAVPGVNEWITERSARGQFRCHALALTALCIAVFEPLLARAAGLLFVVACATLAHALTRAALRYRSALVSA